MARGRLASLIEGFNRGYETTGRVLRDIDMAKIMSEKPSTTAIPAPEPTDPTDITTPRVGVSFLGQTYDKPLDEAGTTRARQLAMAGVMEKYGDAFGGQQLRERVSASDAAATRAARDQELFPLQKRNLELGVEGAQLGVENARRAGRIDQRKEDSLAATDALNRETGEWLKTRLSNPDGSARQATPDDYLAATQFRIGRLIETGKTDEAIQAQSQYNAAALAKISLDTAQRNDAIGRTVSAIGAGDLNAAAEFYNRYVPDGSRVTGVSRGKDGQVIIQRQSEDGQPMQPTTLKDVNQLVATLSSFKDPMALYQWSQGEFNRDLALRADRRAAAAEGRAGAQATREQKRFDEEAPTREAAAEVAKLRVSLAKENDPAKASEIEAKIRALTTGTKGAGGGHDPAVVATARTLVATGAYPDMATALEGVISKPDQTHKTFVDQGLKNMRKPEDAVRDADQVMLNMGWRRNGARWTKADGAAVSAAPAGSDGPPKARFATAAEAEKAVAEGKLRPGDRVMVNGRMATVQ